MRSFAAVAAFAGVAAAGVLPLPNGFPTKLTPASTGPIGAIQQQAHGTLPNGPPPPSLSTDGKVNLQLIALNEIFEVAYFTELINNVTNNVPGYHIEHPKKRETVLEALIAVQAQEELHALNANFALNHFGVEEILPCKYSFPVDNFDDAIALAATFTDVVLGTLQDVSMIFAENGDAGLVRAVASVIGQEGEQVGFYRALQKKIPSALPFLTTSARDFAFTAIQGFTVPGSCPNIHTIPLKTFKGLNVVTPPQAQTCDITLSYEGYPVNGLSVVYINQQNVPVVEQVKNVQSKNGKVTFQATFPYDKFEMNGLTIVALTNTAGPFASADAVADATIFGPGLIEIK